MKYSSVDSWMFEDTDTIKEKKFRIPPKYIISYNNKIKLYWDRCVLIFAFYNSLMIPFKEAFIPQYKSKWMDNLDLVIDFIFLFDILLMFVTSVVNR